MGYGRSDTIRRMFSSLGRKCTDHALDNYVEHTRDYDERTIERAVDWALEEADVLPSPNRLKKLCRRLTVKKEVCGFCDGKGYRDNSIELGRVDWLPEYAGTVSVCCCAGDIADKVEVADPTEIYRKSVAMIMAKAFCERAKGHVYWESEENWRRLCWDHCREEWAEVAEMVDTPGRLCQVTDYIKGLDPSVCLAAPHAMAYKIVSKIKSSVTLP